jgi:DNA end-binding protein Ku
VTKPIGERTGPWTPDMVGDPVQAQLLDIIAETKQGARHPAIF